MTKEQMYNNLNYARSKTHSILEPYFDDAKLARSGLLQALERVWTVDCRDFRFPHPWIGPMNAYEWLMFIAVHERGHQEHLQKLLNSVNHS